jgi:hypothetical protein
MKRTGWDQARNKGAEVKAKVKTEAEVKVEETT